MSYPNLYREILEMVRDWAWQKSNANRVVRKADFRPGLSAWGGPIPILSLPGSRAEITACSVELQDLIDDFHADPTDEARDALVAYLETELGQTLEEEFAEEFAEVEATGLQRRVRVQIGADTVELVLEPYGATEIPGGYQVTLEGETHFDITQEDFSHADNAEAWTTGIDPNTLDYATSPYDSIQVHLAQGQEAGMFHGAVTPVVDGTFKAWRKNPQRILDIDPPVITVPSSPSIENPVRASLRWEAQMPRHGEFVRFFVPGRESGKATLYSHLPAPVYFGFLLRSDAEVAGGHPLTDWWFDLENSLFPGPNDAFNPTNEGLTRISGQSTGYNYTEPSLSAASSGEDLDTHFDAFHALIYEGGSHDGQTYSGRNGTTADSDPSGESVMLTTDGGFQGWVCMFWWHYTDDWYWTAPGVQGSDSSAALYELEAAQTGLSQSFDEQDFTNEMNRIKWSAPSGPADETVEYLFPAVTNVDGDPFDPLQPATHRNPSVLGRGPWVRIDPGSTPDGGTRLADAECLTVSSYPEWPGEE